MGIAKGYFDLNLDRLTNGTVTMKNQNEGVSLMINEHPSNSVLLMAIIVLLEYGNHHGDNPTCLVPGPYLNEDHQDSSVPGWRSALAMERWEYTYAAVAPRASNGFATMAKERTIRNTETNTVITVNFIAMVLKPWRIQRGAMSIVTPTVTITPEANLSMRSVE